MGTIEAAKRKDVDVVSAKKSKTKRQRRKEIQKNSDKNKWLIQHPKVQSMDRREKIYIKDAGLNETKAEKRQAPIDPKLDLMSPEVKFGRILAGTDQRKRHAAVKKLKAYLKARCDMAEVVNNEQTGNERGSGGISELDLLKLWKALWFTLYMADKRPVQDELSKNICQLLWCVVGTEEEDECAGRAYLEMTEDEERELEEQEQKDGGEYDVTMEEIENTLEEEKNSDNEDDNDSEDIDNDMEDDEDSEGVGQDSEEESDEMIEIDDSEIHHCRGAHLASLFVRTFFRTIRRDWGSMDKYRIDKFYTLIRLMIHEIYEYMSVRSWNYGIVLLLNDAIFAEILKEPPNGLRYHLIDLCLEELAKVNAKAKIPLTEATFLDVLEPFFGLSQTGRHDDTVQQRVVEKVIHNFLDNYSVISENALREDEDDDESAVKTNSLIFRDVHVKTIAEFLFTLGSDPDTIDKYRKSLYDSHKKFIRRLKKIGKDVVITMDEDGNEIYDDGDVAFDDVSLDKIDESIEFLESETNDAIPDNSDENLGDNDVDTKDDEADEARNSTEEVTKESKKKKKKKKRKSIEEETSPSPNATKDLALDEIKKQKKNIVEVSADEEVIITLTEQEDAKKKDRIAKKKLKQEKEEEDNVSADQELGKSGEKHVSFGKKNRAKSHKASMKALRTAKPPSTKEAAPENGILRKVPRHKSKLGKTSTSGLSKKNRKKASSYF